MGFGERLKKLREEKGVTQQQLADYLSVGRPTIAGYETKNKEPDYEKLTKIAKYFNCSVDWLLGITDHRTPSQPDKVADGPNDYHPDDYIAPDEIKLSAHDENSSPLSEEESRAVREIVRQELMKIRKEARLKKEREKK